MIWPVQNYFDLKDVIFEKIHSATSEVVEVVEVIFEVTEAEFWISSSFNKFSFHFRKGVREHF